MKCLMGKVGPGRGPPGLALDPDASRLTILFLVSVIPGKITGQGVGLGVWSQRGRRRWGVGSRNPGK